MSDIIASLILGAIGAGLGFTIQVARHRIQNARLRKRYPVAGRFVTEFEDIEDDQRIVRRALSTIEQDGKTLRGETVNLEDGRSWWLRATIEDGGIVHGIYGATDPHDTGTGTLFLEVDGMRGDMTGMWGGYDSVNRRIEGGRYTFRRSPVKFVRPARSTEASQVLALLGDALGDRYIELESIEKKISSSPDSTCLVATGESGGILGAITASLLSPDTFREHLPVGQEALLNRELRRLRYHGNVGHLEGIAVSDSCRQRGVASQLVEAALDWFEDSGATVVVSFGWSSNGRPHVAGVFDGHGFEQVAEIGNFWSEDAQAKGYDCPSCGTGCRCSAVIYAKSLAALAS